MKLILARYLKALFIVVYLVIGALSILQYVIDFFYNRIDLTYLISGIIAILTGIFVFPAIINSFFNLSNRVEFYEKIIPTFNKIVFRNSFSHNQEHDILNFKDMDTWKKARSLHPRAYRKPLSILLTTVFIFFLFQSEVHNMSRIISENTMDYWFSSLIIMIFVQFPIYITFLYLNYIFYPWTKMLVINMWVFKRIFISDEGLVSYMESVNEFASKEYDRENYVMITRRYGSTNKRYTEISDKKKILAYQDAKLKKHLLACVRITILYFTWAVSFILGWIAVPWVMYKLNKDPYNIKFIKYFYAKRLSAVLDRKI